ALPICRASRRRRADHHIVVKIILVIIGDARRLVDFVHVEGWFVINRRSGTEAGLDTIDAARRLQNWRKALILVILIVVLVPSARHVLGGTGNVASQESLRRKPPMRARTNR